MVAKIYTEMKADNSIEENRFEMAVDNMTGPMSKYSLEIQ